MYTNCRFEEIVIHMPYKEIQLRPKSRKSDSGEEHQHLKIAVHYGPKEEMVAMATIENEDLESLVRWCCRKFSPSQP